VLLILGGTGEASELARRLAEGGHATLLSLAGRTRAPAPAPCPTRSGGFGGIDGLEAFLRCKRPTALVDATHPFAARMPHNAAAACRRASVPRLRLLRPPWQRLPGDDWREAGDMEEAAALLPGLGGPALVTVGHEGLDALARVAALHLVIRSIEKPALSFPHTWIGGRGPFALADELALMRTRGIRVLVGKASGGAATYAKIAAARELALPVVMLRRPPRPEGPTVGSVDAALAWVDDLSRAS
jgi:precorrin-6A/cobalt-precorrin-6A reductase